MLIIYGSPRKNGSTASLIKTFTSGAEESGNEVREAYIRGTDYSMALDQYGIYTIIYGLGRSRTCFRCRTASRKHGTNKGMVSI
ncbi:MAG: hypothetical protein IKZ90_09015 [Clostridiales bacterium]|nr:hypothetical protein [Clostridiales bacterium]